MSTPAENPKPANRAVTGRFNPGFSGNLSGRPKQIVTEAYRAALTPAARKRIAQAMVKKAARGSVIAIKEITDRVEGKAPQTIQHTGEDGHGPIRVRLEFKEGAVRTSAPLEMIESVNATDEEDDE